MRLSVLISVLFDVVILIVLAVFRVLVLGSSVNVLLFVLILLGIGMWV